MQAANQVRAKRQIRPPARRMPNRLDLDLDRKILPKASLIFKINIVNIIRYPALSLNTVPDNFLLLHEGGLEDFAGCPLGPSRSPAETSHFQRCKASELVILYWDTGTRCERAGLSQSCAKLRASTNAPSIGWQTWALNAVDFLPVMTRESASEF